MSASFVLEDRYHVTQHERTAVEPIKRNRVYSVNYAGTVTDASEDWLHLSGVTGECRQAFRVEHVTRTLMMT